MYSKLQKRTHTLLQPAKFGDSKSRSFDNLLHGLIFLNLIAVTLDSVSSLRAGYSVYFDYFEIFSVVVFSADFLARLWTAPLENTKKQKSSFNARLKYIFSFG